MPNFFTGGGDVNGEVNYNLGAWRYTLNNALFMTAIANLEWSRGYLWYVELDDVPFPFQRGGVIGLPVTDVTYDLVASNSTSINGFDQYSFPLNRQNTNKITMTILDDEKGTIFTFFERWFNNIYNSKAGVLPVTEACKGLSIYKLKSTRARITRYTYSYDIDRQLKLAETKRKTTSRDFLVYPTGTLQETNSYDSKVRSYSINFNVVHQYNPDYGDPSKHEGVLEVKGIGGAVGTFLKKAASYF